MFTIKPWIPAKQPYYVEIASCTRFAGINMSPNSYVWSNISELFCHCFQPHVSPMKYIKRYQYNTVHIFQNRPKKAEKMSLQLNKDHLTVWDSTCSVAGIKTFLIFISMWRRFEPLAAKLGWPSEKIHKHDYKLRKLYETTYESSSQNIHEL